MVDYAELADGRWKKSVEAIMFLDALKEVDK